MPAAAELACAGLSCLPVTDTFPAPGTDTFSIVPLPAVIAEPTEN